MIKVTRSCEVETVESEEEYPALYGIVLLGWPITLSVIVLACVLLIPHFIGLFGMKMFKAVKNSSDENQ